MDLSNENIIHVKKEKIEYIQFRKLLEYSDTITHAYVLGLDKNFRTSRANNQELSKEEYNLAEDSYKTLCEALNINYNDIVKTNQTHSDNVRVIENKINIDEPDFAEYPRTDGLITNKSNLILSTTNADCILLMFFDPVKKVIANVHSGWKGTLQRISVKTVEKMQSDFECDVKDIICCITPSIRKCHFEVDRDVYELFFNEFQDLNERDEFIEKNENKWHIDTVLINKILLNKLGLRDENIIDCGICSVCNKNIVHSYRAEGQNYGLSTAVIDLK
jgi:hypothetical protein